MATNTHDPSLATQPLPIESDKSRPRKPLRLWPGIVLAALIVLLRFIVPVVAPDAIIAGLPVAIISVFGGMLATLAVLLWWLLFSRAPWLERLGALALMVLAVLVTYRLVHPSIAGGAMGALLPVMAVPIMAVALVAWAVGSRRLNTGLRWLSMAIVIFLVCGVFTLIRTGGFTGNFKNDFHWRWTKSPEELLVAKGDEPTVAPPATATTNRGYDWLGFRGSQRDGIVHGVRLETDWTNSPPKEMWRRPIGPGWSSFAVHGDLVYTQEQRGNEEIVACYNLNDGKPVWRHKDAARFYESNGGAGPRGTPTLNNDRVYTLGATGILNALDAATGNVIWSRNAAADTKTKTPGWGFSGSPLVIGDIVIVATGGTLAAYDMNTGQPRWFGPNGGGGYSSPHQVTINGVTQVVMLGDPGAIGVNPSDGKVLWQYALPSGTRIIQPAVTEEGDLLLSVGDGNDVHRIAVANTSGGWKVEERWASSGINPFFNDFVVHKGHAFGFVGSEIACMDLKDGSRKWNEGNYGHGQLVLLADQDLLLVLTESGDIALVKAATDRLTELARIPAIKGKTWNHPVVVGDVVLVRNGEEMAAFKLPVARS
ncbi:MAG TPA: PQQ-binding-like beta-propeller repeat protein [Pyrinomonadaceae bacterium]|nr:PQQ-binding-like beta-propeller repeat protein [Pyrinomonadaceae bacterium]